MSINGVENSGQVYAEQVKAGRPKKKYLLRSVKSGFAKKTFNKRGGLRNLGAVKIWMSPPEKPEFPN